MPKLIKESTNPHTKVTTDSSSISYQSFYLIVSKETTSGSIKQGNQPEMSLSQAPFLLHKAA